MGKRGPKPGSVSKYEVSQKWRPELAYAIGLLSADGCLFPTGHYINLTSKDVEQVKNFSKCLGIGNKVSRKSAGHGKRNYFQVQFKNVLFYEFLESIGLTPKKSKTLGPVAIPTEYFWDFLRGVYDGDGCSYSYWDPRWRSSLMFYTAFASASTEFVLWLKAEIQERTGCVGRITRAGRKGSVFQLRYAKAGSMPILHNMYKRKNCVCLSRKRLKVERFLATVGERL